MQKRFQLRSIWEKEIDFLIAPTILINRIIYEHNKRYGNFIFIGDFNLGFAANSIKKFFDINDMKSLIKVPAYLKNPVKPQLWNPVKTCETTTEAIYIFLFL